MLKPGGRFAVEIGYDQKTAVEDLFRQAGAADMTPRVLEVNPDHPLIQGLAERAKKGDGQDPLIADAAHLLLDQARIVEGEALADPQAFLRRMTAVMESGLKV